MDIRRRPREKSTIWPYLLLLPALIVMLSVVIVPIINAVSMSFQSYNLTKPKKIGYIGLQNYATLLHDPLFWSSLLRTAIWVVFGVGCQFLFGFLLALVLNKQFKGRGVVRAVSLIPWVTPGVLIALMWRWMYDGNYGVINDLLMRLGLIKENIAFLSKPGTAMPSVIVTIVWQGIPFFALMLLAGLQGISYDLYEAASIDGATGWQKLIYVTIPSLRNTIFVTTMLRIIWVANSVDVIFNMTEGGPAYATQTLSVYIYKKASALDMGYASAMAIMLMLVLLLAAIPYLRNTFRDQEG
ncbi:MAG: sugar ABC transporter permease [Clostridia bacterium]|nr:sugar ABC transporter permease [Clostridia bacterium]MBQ6326454.1 sugar ABC transporter permease [Clostridia bacterium]MBQ8962920.1 sugar ABC transporter permease [Clostridia bacterium]MBQ9039936.1 sugar ABC transporter permease [Clostridia bacterium]